MGRVEIDPGDHLMAEQHLALRIGLGHRAQGDGQPAQRLTDAEGVSPVAHPALGLHLAHVEAGRVVDGRQGFRKQDGAGAITADGRGQVQPIVRTVQIVAVAEAIEFVLAVLQGGEIEVAQDLELKRAMEAFVLALGLQTIGAAMTDPEAESDQPQAQAGEGQIAVAPWRAIVHQHRGWQPIAAKHCGQCLLHGGAALVGAGFEQQAKRE
jgi:hypothetical protein